MTIRITHNREEGTLVDGTARGDGSGKILGGRGGCGFRFSRSLECWYLPHSRDQAAKSWVIDRAAAELRKAGFEVEVEVDNVTVAATPFAEREAERYGRAEDRADRYGDRADRASGTGERMWNEVRERMSHIPLGQPILVGHHSETRHRNFLKKMHRKEGRAIDEMKRGEYWAGRADAAASYQHGRENIPTTLRRIEKLKARQRQIGRELEGSIDHWGHEEVQARIAELAERGITAKIVGERDRWGVQLQVPIGPERKAVLDAELAQLAGQIDYWEEHVRQAEAEGVKVWRREDFRKGDFVNVGHGWFEVMRVNAKSVTVPWSHLGIGRKLLTVEQAEAMGRGKRDDGKLYTDTAPYDNVRGRLSPEEARERFPEHFAARLEEPAGPAE